MSKRYMIYTKYLQTLQAYLKSKLPDVPEHMAQEIAAHISNQTIILVQDMLCAQAEDFKREISRGKRAVRHRNQKEGQLED